MSYVSLISKFMVLSFPICKSKSFIHFVPNMQERRAGKDNSQPNRDFQQENRAGAKIGDKQLGGETSDTTSEGDSERIHHQPTRLR